MTGFRYFSKVLALRTKVASALEGFKFVKLLCFYFSDAISQFFQCFSLVNSLHKLFRAPKSERTIGCLNGLRVISILWIMLGHTFLGAFASNVLGESDFHMKFIFAIVQKNEFVQQ